MSKTPEQLEAENAALRAVLAAIGDAMPPLPADSGKMRAYWAEAASRLSMAAIVAGATAAKSEDWAPQHAREEAKALRASWAAPLHYEAELPDRRECTCGHPGTSHIYTAPSPCTECGCLAYSTAAAADGTPAPHECRS